MAQDVEQLDLSNVDKNNLIDEVSGFDRLVVTDTNRLYGFEGDKRTPVTNLGHIALEALAKAADAEVERLAPAGPPSRRERNQSGNDIEVRIQRAVEQAIEQVLAGAQAREQHLQEEINQLRQEIERLQKPLHERLDEAFGDNWVPRDEGIAVARRGSDGFTEDGWTTASQPYEKDGKWYTRIKKDNNEEEAELASLIRVPETPPPADEAAQRQQQREELETRISDYEGVNLDNLYQTYRQHLQHEANTDEREAFANNATRAAVIAEIRSEEIRNYIDSMNEQQRNALPADAVRDLMAWLELRDAQEPPITPAVETATQNPDGQPVHRRRSWISQRWDRIRGRQPTQYYVDDSGRYYRVVDEEVEYVAPGEVDRGGDGTARALGLVALAGVAGLTIWELLEHKYIGHSPTREARHNGLYPFLPHKHGGHFGHIPSHGAGNNLPNGAHTDFYNPALGHRRTGVEATSTINLVGRPGNEHLVDGHKVLLGGHKVEWDSQGKLSVWDRMKLRKEGYDIGWGKLQDKLRGINRFKTIVIKR